MSKQSIDLMYFKKLENRQVLLEKNFSDRNQLLEFIRDEKIARKDILAIEDLEEIFNTSPEHFDV